MKIEHLADLHEDPGTGTLYLGHDEDGNLYFLADEGSTPAHAVRIDIPGLKELSWKIALLASHLESS